MKVSRLFVENDGEPYEDIEFETREALITDHSTGEITHQATVEVPKHWSLNATNILSQKYMRKAGVPDQTTTNDQGEWLPVSLRPSRAAEGANIGAERSARQVFNRLAGCWAYHGLKNGYFSIERDAANFFDEMRHMLCQQMGAPNSPQWFNTGLHWAYGIEGTPQGHYYQEDGSSEAVPSSNEYERVSVSACFIVEVEDNLVKDHGIIDTVMTEARIFKHGSGTGSNFSTIRAENEPLSSGGRSSGLMSFLRINDRGAGAIKSGGTTRRAAKMCVLDIDHPDVTKFTRWKVQEEQKVAALAVGTQMLRNFQERMEKAASGNWDTKSNSKLKEVVEAGLVLGIPEPFINKCVMLGSQGEGQDLVEICDTGWQSDAYNTVSGQNSNNSISATDDFFEAVAQNQKWNLYGRVEKRQAKEQGREPEPWSQVDARELWTMIVESAWQCADPGIQYSTTINDWHTCPNDGRIESSNPCSEYLFLNNTSCNLASLNLLSFWDGEDFDCKAFVHAVRLWTIALEISVSMGQFPTKKIAEGTHDYRTLGLGFANLGALLMQMGLPYDSEAGRSVAGAIMALLHFTSYETSAEMAERLGPFARYEENKDAMLNVLNNHAAALKGFTSDTFHRLGQNPPQLSKTPENADIFVAAEAAAERMLQKGLEHGYRNAQTTVLAPTGTISFVMDCDTTGIEPEMALVKYKSLAGGGSMMLVNQSVAPALKKLGFSDGRIEEILAYIDEKGMIEGAPGIDDDQVEKVFSCANRCGQHGRQYIAPMGHVKMMAACQPFISGAISKTVNLPAEATVADISNIYLEAHRLCVKAIAVYRDQSKLSQPVNVLPPDSVSGHSDVDLFRAITEAMYPPDSHSHEEFAGMEEFENYLEANHPSIHANGRMLNRKDLFDVWVKARTSQRGVRYKLPSRRRGYHQGVHIAGHTIYLSVGEYEDGTLGEIWLTTSRAGSPFQGILNGLAVAISLGLQHGTPLEAFVKAFVGTRFEPSGMVQDHPYIKFCTSVLDWIFRELAITYLNMTEFANVDKSQIDTDWTPDDGEDVWDQHRLRVDGPVPVNEVPIPGQVTPESLRVGKQAVEDFSATMPQTFVRSTAVLDPKPRYEGEECPNCHALTVVSSGTCKSCQTCGETSGCG